MKERKKKKYYFCTVKWQFVFLTLICINLFSSYFLYLTRSRRNRKTMKFVASDRISARELSNDTLPEG